MIKVFKLEIKLKKEYLRASARMTGKYFQFKETDNLLLSLPIFGIGGKMILIKKRLPNREPFFV